MFIVPLDATAGVDGVGGDPIIDVGLLNVSDTDSRLTINKLMLVSVEGMYISEMIEFPHSQTKSTLDSA
ncbi:hypothetical protein ASF16_03920 [Acidovorax sp. Leaf78]|nr:hypothetical protein ASF16_03920 [Acidovorax sp. Leaf78]